MTQFKYLKEIVTILEKFPLGKFEKEAIPCTLEEVEALESILPHPYKLPTAYKEFLLYGGRKIGNLTELNCLSYEIAKIFLENKYRSIMCMLEADDKNARLPSDIFVISEHGGYNFTYFLLTEGENPPIYWWEEGEGGLEFSQKDVYFSEYLKKLIRVESIYLCRQSRKEIEHGNPPRGQQFWVHESKELLEGITLENLLTCLGFGVMVEIEVFKKALSLTGLDRDSYLEELSGWKCRKVSENNSEVRFFPPEASKE